MIFSDATLRKKTDFIPVGNYSNKVKMMLNFDYTRTFLVFSFSIIQEKNRSSTASWN